jgi:anti-anti-sigma factor
MDIVVEHRAPTTVVRINGSVDGLTADTLMTTLQQQIDAGNTRLVADLSGVSYTSSAGLRALLATVKQARSAGGDFRLAGVLPPVQKVLEMSGFTSILKLYPDVDGAVASYPG